MTSTLPLKETVVVTGGAGFIGSHLVDELMVRRADVHVVDNLSSGRLEFLASLAGKPGFTFHKVDLLDANDLASTLASISPAPTTIFHFAACPQVRIGADEQRTHWRQNVEATYNLLEAARAMSDGNYPVRFVFASTSAVYGSAKVVPTPEDYGPLLPISMYAASKVAAEALVSAFCDNLNWPALVFRFGNVVGPRGTHGVIPDFISKLRANASALEILGDGKQSKSYLHVWDCVEGVLFACAHRERGIGIYNLSTEEQTSVAEIASIVIQCMGLSSEKVEKKFTNKAAWAGDVTHSQLDISKIKRLGWKPRFSSKEAVWKAAKAMVDESKIATSLPVA